MDKGQEEGMEKRARKEWGEEGEEGMGRRGRGRNGIYISLHTCMY